MSRQNSQNQPIQCTHLSEQIVHEGNWLKFSNVKYLDPSGKERIWEAITRVTRPHGMDTDSVTAISIYRRMLHYDVLVLVKQYRPSLNAYTIEFPAGLVESGESGEEAAMRKLKEETGWHGEVTHCTRALGADPACTSVTVRYATVKINGDSLENQNIKPIPKNDKGEFIELVMIPLSEVQERLTRLANEGHVIDASVAIWSIGLQMGLKVAKDAELDAVSEQSSSLPSDGNSIRTGLFTRQVT